MNSTGLSCGSLSKSMSLSQSVPRLEHVLQDPSTTPVVINLEPVTMADIEEGRLNAYSHRQSSTIAIRGSFSTSRYAPTNSISTPCPPSDACAAGKLRRHSTAMSTLTAKFPPRDLRDSQTPSPGLVAHRHVPYSITQCTTMCANSEHESPTWTQETTPAASAPDMRKTMGHRDASKPSVLVPGSREVDGRPIEHAPGPEKHQPSHWSDDSSDEEIFGLTEDRSEPPDSNSVQPGTTSWLRLTPEGQEDIADESEASDISKLG